MFSLFAVAIVCSFCCTWVSAARQRWYYTGKFKHDTVEEEFFEGATLDLFSLYNYQSDDQSYLYAGGLLLSPVQPVESKENATFNLDSSDLSFIHRVVASASFDVKSTSSYTIFLNPNYHRIPRMGSQEILEAEVGLFDHDREEYVQLNSSTMSIGKLHATLVQVPADEHHAQPTLHRLMWTWDMFGRNSIIHHTWHVDHTSVPPNTECATDTNDAGTGKSRVDAEGKLRVMTYNLWHHNPPSWVYHDKRQRWERYEQRIRHFAEQIVLEDPDLIAVQEVRLDSTFFHPKKTIPFWNLFRNETKLDSGSQIEHLLSAIDVKLQELLTEEERAQRVPYQVLYHPSMLQTERGRLNYRHEEGLLLLSKYPIVAAEALFLPREVGLKEDDHQRVALIMQVDVQSATSTATATATTCAPTTTRENEQVVTLVTSHFSLYTASRERGVEAIRRHLNRIDHTPRGADPLAAHNPLTTSEHAASHLVDTHPESGVVGEAGSAVSVRPSMAEILLGDFNAEPHEQTIQYLLAPLPQSNPDDDNEVPFVDAWVAQPQQATSSADDSDSVDAAGLTFPACNPVKRIDFILYRCPAVEAAKAQSLSQAQATELWQLDIDAVRVTGRAPTKDTEHLVGSRPDLGMNDLDSPIWASDHFAVVADMTVRPFARDRTLPSTREEL